LKYVINSLAPPRGFDGRPSAVRSARRNGHKRYPAHLSIGRRDGSSMAAANPITVRLERLYAQWLDFVDDPPARVLRWLIRDDEYRMIETFVALESSEGGRTMDLFVRVTAPFERMASHALELRNELLQTCRDSQDERVTSWAPPPCTRGVHDELVAACDSLIAHIRGHGLAIDHLVIVLLPATIFAQPAWQQWVRDLAVALRTSDTRVVVVEDLDAPILSAMDPGVHTAVAELDMPRAHLEISARVGDLDAPPGRFRHAYITLLHALGARDLAAAQAAAAQAEAVARTQGWWQLELAVAFALGTGFLAESSAVPAIRWFRHAESIAIRHEADEAALPLRIKCRLGMAAAAYQAGSFAEAAELYAATAPLAHACTDAHAELDCRRMAGHCHERAGRIEQAWTSTVAALQVGAAMDAAARRTSTLAHAGEQALHLTKRHQLSHYRNAIDQQMRGMLGDDWRATARAKASAA